MARRRVDSAIGDGAIADETQGLIVSGRDLRRRDQARLDHRRHEDRPADLRVAERVDDLTGYEILLQIQGAAPPDGEEAREGSGGVIERDDEEAALPRAGAERKRRLGEIRRSRRDG